MKRKLFLAGLAVLGVIASLLAAAYLAMTMRFNPSPPSSDFPKPRNSLEAQRQDLEQFKRLVALDRSYSAQNRALANRTLDAMRASSHVLSWGALRVTLMRIAAMADNGHTGVYSDGPRPNMIPLRVSEFSDGLFVLRAKAPYSDLLGSRVEKIDDVPSETVLRELDKLRGGTDAFRRTASAIWVQSPTILNGLGIAANPATTVWTFKLPNGDDIERTLPGEPLTQSPHAETRWLSPEPLATESTEWKSFLSVRAPLPLPLRDFDKTFRREWVGKSCVLFLQMKAIEDGPDQKISDWISETEDAMAARPPCAVILDLRYNGGGDYTNTWRFTHKLPSLMRPGARVYLLTGPETFSAAITTAAFVKETFGDRAVILGEAVGDRMRFLSEGNHGCLPNSRICLHYSTGMHDYSAPCTDWKVCYWLNWIFPVRVKTLAPDEVITDRFSDYLAGRDPVFERAVALATRGAN